MSATDISRLKGGDPFLFDYAHADVAQTLVFDENNWGLYKAENVSLTDAIRPDNDDDGNSLPGVWTASVTTAHLTSFTSAHVSWDGSGFTAEYTLDGTAWHALAQHGVVNMGTDPDFDVRITFNGGVEEDPAQLTSLTVYVLATDTLLSDKGIRTLTFSADPMIDGAINIDTTMTVAAAPGGGTLPTQEGPATGSVDLRIGTIEMWVTLNAGTTALVSPPAGTYYTNGVAGNPTAGVRRHVVYVLTSLANTAFTVGPNMTVDHLAVYPQKMTPTEVGDLYAANIGGTFRVDDTGVIGVTERTPATDIYAYAWSMVTTSTS